MFILISKPRWLWKKYSRKDFVDQEIVLDNRSFVKCAFFGCSFVYYGGDFDLIDCYMQGAPGKPYAIIKGAAANTYSFIRGTLNASGDGTVREAIARELGLWSEPLGDAQESL